MSLKAKIILFCSILLGLLAGQVIITLSYTGQIAALAAGVAKQSLEHLDQISKAEADLAKLHLAEHTALLTGNFNEFSATWQLFRSVQDRLNEQATPDLLAAFAAYAAARRRVEELLAQGEVDRARATFTAARAEFRTLEEGIAALAARLKARTGQEAELAMRLAERARFLLALALLLAALVEVGLGWYLVRSLTTGLGRLMEGIRWAAAGNLEREIAVGGQDEFAYLAGAFNAMIRSLRETQAENARLHQAALEMHQQHIRWLREQFSRIVKAQEDERQRVARELHDQAGQALTAIQFGLARLEKAGDLAQARQEAAALRALTIQTMDEIRNLAVDLRPSMLDDLGLLPALRQYLRDFGRRTGIMAELVVSGTPRRLLPELETNLFRVVQEALTNTAKHAGATKVTVLLDWGQTLTVRVEDDGRGFDLEQALRNTEKRSLGLFGMQERVALFGGRLSLQSQPGRGTVVEAEIPLLPGHLAAPQEGVPLSAS